MEKIKVLEMIDQPFLGGGQKTLLSLVRHLDRKKFSVSVCSQDSGPLVEEVKKNGIVHFPISFSKKFKWRIIREISSILLNNRFDILHTHGGIAGFYGRWAAKKCRTRVVVHTLHGIHYLHYRNLLLKQITIFLERIFSRFTDALVFVCDSDREKGKKLKLAPQTKMHLIRNGIDLPPVREEDVLARRKELGLNLSQPVLGTVARLHRQKGIIYLLQAAAKIQRSFPEAKIFVVGGGPLRQRLQRERQRLGVDKFLFFLGERKDAAEILSLFDIFILPSLWEGLPYVLIEAASAGKPIVATDVDGVKEVITNGETGVLVAARNSEKLAEAVISLLRNRDHAAKLGEKAKKTIPSHFSLSRMIEETQELYLEMMGTGTFFP